MIRQSGESSPVENAVSISRRSFLESATVAMMPAERVARYRLGCQTLPYRAHPLPRALEGIRKAGYRFVMPYQTHANKTVFAPSLTPGERVDLQRQFKDHGLEVFMAFIGLTRESRLPEGLNGYLAELDFYKECGIDTVVGVGPWYFAKFPNLPKRARDWQPEVDAYYRSLEQAVRHAEQIGVTITLKPHTGITATAKACLDVVARTRSQRLKICWDAGNVSFYEGIWPDPDLPDLAPHVRALCIKDHRGGRAEANFPVPGEGQIDHEAMFRILFGGGFRGPIALERVDGRDDAAAMPPELIDERIRAARHFLLKTLEGTV
jgi:sugar phosphate isomerase/epimerase